MNENTKTLTFVGAAAVLLLSAWLLRPSTATVERQDDIGKEFFPEFKDPLAATTWKWSSMTSRPARCVPSRWRRQRRMVDSLARGLSGRRQEPARAGGRGRDGAGEAVDGLGLARRSGTYGVIDPDAAKLQAGASGVGKRVTLEDKGGNKLAEFIIGKKDPDRPELHYVRVPGQDRVYRAVVKTDKLSTKFQNWIEQDLLKLNAFDVKQVVMDDHSVDELNQNQPIIQRGLTIVDFDNKDSKWTLEEMEACRPGHGQVGRSALKDDEELDTQKLNDLKTALDDLKIVDVRHKPAGLSKDLKAGEELVADRATRQALQQRGFYLAPTRGALPCSRTRAKCACGLNDGVEYILHFGEIAGQGSADEG